MTNTRPYWRIFHATITCLFLFPSVWLTGQEVVRNEENRQVVVYPDGTWRYFSQDTISSIDSPEELFTPSHGELTANREEWDAALKRTSELKVELIRERLRIATLTGELSEKSAAGEAEEDLKQIRLSIEAARQNEGRLSLLLSRSESWSQLMEGLLYMPQVIRKKKIKDWLDEQASADVAVTAAPATTVNDATSRSKSGRTVAKEDCQLAFSGLDPTTGELRKETGSRVLFSHTDKGLEDHLGKQDLILAKGYLTSMTGGVRVLHLDIAIASFKAPQLFGVLLKGGYIELHLLDGTVLKLINNVSDSGVWNETLRSYLYHSQYPLGVREEKALRQTEVDKIVIRWSKVQDEFEIFDVDFFIDQFECLDNGK